jgi:UDP-glucose 4-epimerase
MTRVLVTGGAGFIGSHLTDRLLSDGHEVTVVDNLVTGLRTYVSTDATFVEGDVADRALVDEVFADQEFDAVFHIAGQASIRLSFSEPEVDLRTNVIGTVNVLRGCVESGVQRLVYASSMTAYGEPELIPTPESVACVPVSYYGVTKYAAERYVHVTGARPDVDVAVTSLRMFNVYGPRQSISNPYQGVLAIFIGNVLRGEPITIHGDGEQTRDFVFVDDVVAAWLRVLDAPELDGAVLNVGSGRETSVNELADAVLAAFGHARDGWEIRRQDVQLGDQRRAAADNAALSAIGWSASVALRDGVARTVDWARAAERG